VVPWLAKPALHRSGHWHVGVRVTRAIVTRVRVHRTPDSGLRGLCTDALNHYYSRGRQHNSAPRYRTATARAPPTAQMALLPEKRQGVASYAARPASQYRRPWAVPVDPGLGSVRPTGESSEAKVPIHWRSLNCNPFRMEAARLPDRL
jgi:hypothetical protein